MIGFVDEIQMNTCPKCGGENLAAARVCRLCATELPEPKEPVSLTTERPPAETPIKVASPQGTSAPVEGGPVCPSCQTLIDPDWPFCQHCGNRLAASSGEGVDLVSQMRAALPTSQALDRSRAPGSPSKGLVDSNSAKPVKIDPGAQQQPGADRERGSGPAETGPQPPSRQSERNLGLTTSVVCGDCGSIQPAGGAFCADCGAQLSPAAIARALAQGKPNRRASLHLITEGGQVGESYRLDRGNTLIGRAEGDMVFPHDSYMSSRHARIVEREGRYFLIDEGSRNGSFIRIEKEIELEPGDTFLVGKQVLRFETQ
jgi:predicted amidophosphoribosyltransferase